MVAYDERVMLLLKRKCVRQASHTNWFLKPTNVISADGKDLSFITVSVVDRNGNPCPNINELVKFNVKALVLIVLEQMVMLQVSTCSPSQMHLFNGKLVAIVESSETPGTITLEANAKGLRKASIQIQTK